MALTIVPLEGNRESVRRPHIDLTGIASSVMLRNWQTPAAAMQCHPHSPSANELTLVESPASPNPGNSRATKGDAVGGT